MIKAPAADARFDPMPPPWWCAVAWIVTAPIWIVLFAVSGAWQLITAPRDTRA